MNAQYVSTCMHLPALAMCSAARLLIGLAEEKICEVQKMFKEVLIYLEGMFFRRIDLFV